MRRPHERRAIADGGVSDLDIIRGLTKTYGVLGRTSAQPLPVGQGGGPAVRFLRCLGLEREF
jgi:hypothetical protein